MPAETRDEKPVELQTSEIATGLKLPSRSEKIEVREISRKPGQSLTSGLGAAFSLHGDLSSPGRPHQHLGHGGTEPPALASATAVVGDPRGSTLISVSLRFLNGSDNSHVCFSARL